MLVVQNENSTRKDQQRSMLSNSKQNKRRQNLVNLVPGVGGQETGDLSLPTIRVHCIATTTIHSLATTGTGIDLLVPLTSWTSTMYQEQASLDIQKPSTSTTGGKMTHSRHPGSGSRSASGTAGEGLHNADWESRVRFEAYAGPTDADRDSGI